VICFNNSSHEQVFNLADLRFSRGAIACTELPGITGGYVTEKEIKTHDITMSPLADTQRDDYLPFVECEMI
jgi:hypothetical protein